MIIYQAITLIIVKKKVIIFTKIFLISSAYERCEVIMKSTNSYKTVRTVLEQIQLMIPLTTENTKSYTNFIYEFRKIL